MRSTKIEIAMFVAAHEIAGAGTSGSPFNERVDEDFLLRVGLLGIAPESPARLGLDLADSFTDLVVSAFDAVRPAPRTGISWSMSKRTMRVPTILRM